MIAGAKKFEHVTAHHYRLSGMEIFSQITLPELAAMADGPFEPGRGMEIVRGTVPRNIANATPIHEGYLVAAEQALVTPPAGVRYLVESGSKITVGQEKEADIAIVRFFLLGAAFTAAFFQQKLIPVHCGAVTFHGRALAFCGYSRRGKSTLAACLAMRGYTYLADDRVVITRGTTGLTAAPGVPVFHLSDDAAALCGLSEKDSFAGQTQFGKRIYPAGNRAEDQTRPLGAIMIVDWDDTLSEPKLDMCTPFDALEELRRQINYEGYVRAMGLEDMVLDLAADIVRSVPVYRLLRPRGYQHMAAAMELIESVARW